MFWDTESELEQNVTSQVHIVMSLFLYTKILCTYVCILDDFLVLEQTLKFRISNMLIVREIELFRFFFLLTCKL